MLSMLFKVGADATGAERAMAAAAKKGEAAFKSMGKEITGRLAGMFTAGYILDALIGWVQKTAEWADNLGDAADNLGISVEEVQRFEAAAQLAGARVTKMKSALEAVAALQAQAEGGDTRAQGLFGELGINPAGKNPLELMQAIVTASSRGAREMAAAGDIFGRKLQGVINTMEKMGDTVDMNVASQETVDRIGQAMDQMTAGLRSLMVDSADIIVSVLRSIGAYAEGIGESIKAFRRGDFSELMGGPDNFITRSLAAYERMSNTPVSPRSGASTSPPPSTALPIPATPLALQSDALSRIGLFVGGRGDVGNQLVTIGNYQLTELRAIRANMEHANR